MPEKGVRIPVGTFDLEGLMEGEGRTRFAVLCHPHPLYGGTMDNNVVSALQIAFQQAGFGTLRFNFRGVGGSGGAYGQGNGEAEDILVVIDYLRARGVESFHLAGYSFGAWVVLKAVQRNVDVHSFVLVSPPIDFLDFKELVLPVKPCLMTLGSRDSFCAERSLREWVGSRDTPPGLAKVEILPDCDHFYWGYEETLLALVSAFIADGKRSNDG